ncbi:hypothetical protein V3C99_011409 [Haemonchus contortus]
MEKSGRDELISYACASILINIPPYQQQNSLSYSCCQCQRQQL